MCLPKSVPEAYKPMRVRAQQISEVLTEQFPVICTRDNDFSKCQSRLKNTINIILVPDMV